MILTRNKALVALAILFLLFPRISSAQQIDTLIITGIQERTSLQEYLNEVCAESGCRFFYADGMLDEIYLYSTDNGKPLTDYLEVNLAKQGIVHLVYRNRNIVFLERNQLDLRDQSKLAQVDGSGNYYASVNIGDPMLAGKFRRAKLSGYIRNGKTGEPLPGAVIHLPDLNLGVVTDPSGYYNVEIPVGSNPVSYSYIGFEEREIQVNIVSPGSLDIELFESTVAIDQVVITSNSDANVESTEMGMVRMDSKTLNTIPVLMGEPDIMKTMTLLPGIQSSGDMASGFNVRGGGTDQNLIMIDEVPIYNSNHLFGMFSIIDTRTIENLELYKGGAPASYGGRISSFMDIQLKEGNLKQWEGDGNLGLFSSKISLQGPVIKEKASIIFGGRTTYSDWVLNRIPDIDIRKSKANFYDVNAKFNYILNRKNRLSVFTYLSNDYFNLAERNIFQYANRLGSIKWKHISGEKLTYSLNLFYTDYFTETIDTENPVKAISIASGIQQTGTRFRMLWNPQSKHSIETGIEGNYFIYTPGIQEPWGDESNKEADKMEQEQSVDASVYFQDEIEINNQLSISAGLRFTYYAALGPRTINLYESDAFISSTSVDTTSSFATNEVIASYPGFEPRFGLRYVLGSSSSIKLGLSRNYQYQHILSNSSVIIPTDTWKSADKYILPAVGDQASLGFFKNFMGGAIETSLEVYYKRVENILEFKNGAQLVMNKNIEQDVLSAELEAYGAELLIRKNAGRMTGWISYTYSRSFLNTSGAAYADLINYGASYPSYSDKPHDLSIVSTYKISRRFTFSSSFTYSTGKPATFPESQFIISGNPVVNYSDRNKYRLRDYHRLDLSIIWNTSLRKNRNFYSEWILSVYNVYGHKNVFSTYYKKDIPTAKNDYKKFAFYELSIIGVPIPSITYHIRF